MQPTKKMLNVKIELYKLIINKIINDKSALAYGSFSAHVMSGGSSEFSFNDIDFYSDSAYRFMIVLLVLCEVVFDIPAEIFGYPYMVGHLGLRIFAEPQTDNTAIQSLDICDCIYLTKSVIKFIHKIKINKIQIVHPEIQLLRLCASITQRTLSNDEATKYIKNLRIFFPFYTRHREINPPVRELFDIAKLLKSEFILVSVADIVPIFLITSRQLDGYKLRVLVLETYLSNLVTSICFKVLAQIDTQLIVRKSKDFGLFFPVSVFEILKDNKLIGVIIAPLTYDLTVYAAGIPLTDHLPLDTPNTLIKLTQSSTILILILFAIYANLQADHQHEMINYSTLLSEIKYVIGTQIKNEKVLNLNDTFKIKRYKPTGPHLSIRLNTGSFNNLITPKRETNQFVQVYP